jgi:predicted type IV restriction endonuclease
MSLIDEKSLNYFLLKIKQFKQSGVTNSEANTKKRIIEPLIELLGWSFYTNEIQLEYQVTIATSRPRVDYAFLIEGKPVLLIEAKPFDSELTDNEAKQCIDYGRVSDIRWVALTNGKNLMVFDTSRGINSKQCLISNVNLEQRARAGGETAEHSYPSSFSTSHGQVILFTKFKRPFLNLSWVKVLCE